MLTAVLVPGCTAGTADAAPYDKAWSATGAGAHRSSPVAGTLSVGPVVVHADMGGWLRAFRPDGSLAWRAPVDPRPGTRTAVESSPAIGELTGDPGNEVVVGAGAIHPPFLRQDGGVVAYRGDGSVAWRWRSPDRWGPESSPRPDGVSDGIYSSPSIADVDGDGRNDVVFGGWDHNIWALRGSDGSVIPGFPFENTDTVFSSPALHDVDRDGAAEIFIGGDQTYNPNGPGSYDGGVLRSLSVKGGRVVQNWRVNVRDIVASSPAIGDVNRDGRLEAVFAAGESVRPADYPSVWAVHLDDGSVLPGWPVRTRGRMFASAALGDVVPGDGGAPEVVVGDVAGFVTAFRGNGSRAWEVDPGEGDDRFYTSPSIADLDGDGDQDVAIGYAFGGALLLSGHDGRLLRRVGPGVGAVGAVPLVTDFGGTTGRRLVVSGFDPRVPDFSKGEVAAFELPPTSAPAAWPMWRKDPRHLGGGLPPTPVAVPGSAIAAHYAALGGPRGFLGAPLTGERPTPTKPGAYTHYQGGSIYWSPVTGAHEVHGRIRDRWAALGWENGLLGFPETDERRLRDGAYSRFQGGHVYWSPRTDAHEVHGEIFRAWARLGHENSRLGYPTTDERRTPNRPGAYNHFERGSIYWSPATGASAVEGAIREAWARAGWEASCLGFPTSGERATVVGGVAGRVSDFERGTVTWTPAGGAVVRCR